MASDIQNPGKPRWRNLRIRNAMEGPLVEFSRLDYANSCNPVVQEPIRNVRPRQLGSQHNGIGALSSYHLHDIAARSENRNIQDVRVLRIVRHHSHASELRVGRASEEIAN
jgi:hypothetical protein